MIRTSSTGGQRAQAGAGLYQLVRAPRKILNSVAGTLVVAVVLASPVNGADRADKGTLLSIDFARGVIINTARRREAPLLDANRYTIRRDQTTVIEIGQQNSLLFAYEAQNAKTDTEDYQAALTFAKQLKAFLDLFPGGQGGNLAAKRVRGLDPEEFQKDLKTLSDLIEGLPGALTDSLGSVERVAALKDAYATSKVNALTLRLDTDFNVMATIARECLIGPLGLRTDGGEVISCDGPALLNDNVDLGIAVTNATTAADRARNLNAKLADAINRRTEAKKKDKKSSAAIDLEIANLENEKSRADSEVARTIDNVERRRRTPSAKPTLIEFVQLALVLDERVHHSMTLLRDFSADVASVQTPLTLITVPYSIQRQTITVQVKSSGKYEALLDAPTRKKRDDLLRTFTIQLDPYQPAHLSLSPAFVIGFVRNPVFSAVKKGDAFVIEQQDSELTRYTLGAMLNIAPDGWQEPTFGGHFQIGITPTKDQLDRKSVV